MRFTITSVALLTSAVSAFMPSHLAARQSQCLTQCAAINTIVQGCAASGTMDTAYVSCVCTTDNLSQLQGCADCAASDMTIPVASAQQIVDGIAQIQSGCGNTFTSAASSNMASASASAMMSGSSGSAVLSSASAVLSSMSNSMSMSASSASSSTSSASSSVSSQAAQTSAPTSGSEKMYASTGLILASVAAVFLM